jgi:adenylosuccinate synthase
VVCVIGSGCVVDLEVLAGEVRKLKERGIPINPDRLMISERAHVIMPYHRLADRLREADGRYQKIGTTGRGIGPAYEDKMARKGFRIGELRQASSFTEKLHNLLAIRGPRLNEEWGADLPDAALLAESLLKQFAELAPFVTNIYPWMETWIKQGKNILFEGAQGTHLDVDHGTYPFVTSSSTVAGGALTGVGVGPTQITRVMGVAKAYTTRVGEGPFPSELSGEMGEWLRTQGGEFGATTGRARRCGWLDLVVLKHAVRVNGLTELVLTKLDVLTGLARVPIVTAYELDGETIVDMPMSAEDLARCRPLLTELAGWSEDLSALRSRAALPLAVRDYILFIEEYLQIPITMVSVGPGRDEMVG